MDLSDRSLKVETDAACFHAFKSNAMQNVVQPVIQQPACRNRVCAIEVDNQRWLTWIAITRARGPTCDKFRVGTLLGDFSMTLDRPTTEKLPPWKQFQNEVAHLFRISGYEVSQDLLMLFKNVDLLVSERRLGKLHRIAVECKYWNRVLTQQHVSEIYANYLPLVPSSVDEILIVTKSGAAESASAMVAISPHLRHLTYVELHANIMDFRAYLNRMVNQYSDDGLDRYYVPPRTQDDEDLANVVDAWLAAPTGQPIAILGSYGLGKTTFARHLTYKYAQKALADATERIPILVRLGEIANEQSLEGLLGKLFTATHFVNNYNFSTFQELNKLGRFIVLFDGFDEMKQTLSWNDFKYNLRELNRLVGAHSKVIILGRPTAFLTDAEYNYALHGIRKTASYEVRDPEWPDYREISIAPFTKGQMEVFLPEYLQYLIDNTEIEAQKERLRNFIGYDVQHLLDARIGDIARRPVQLKMITEILPDFHGKLAELTVHSLYDYFIDYVIERESLKQARRRYKTPQRRAFMRDIAFWLWSIRERSVSEEAIPGAIVEPYRRRGEDHESVTRDLVSASLLDRRVGGRLFFPHRSFQEFLVAEAIREGVVQKTLAISDIPVVLTQEVSEFLEGFLDKGGVDRTFFAAIASQLNIFRGPLPLRLLKLLCRHSFHRDVIASDSPWALLLTALAVSFEIETEQYFSSNVREVLKTTRDTTTAMLTLFAALVASRKWRNSLQKQPSRMIGEVLEGFCRIVEAERPRKKKKSKVYAHYSASTLVAVIDKLSYSRGKSEDTIVLTGVYPYVHRTLQQYCYVSDWVTGTTLQYLDAGLPDRISEWRSGVRGEFQKFLAAFDQERAALRSIPG